MSRILLLWLTESNNANLYFWTGSSCCRNGRVLAACRDSYWPAAEEREKWPQKWRLGRQLFRSCLLNCGYMDGCRCNRPVRLHLNRLHLNRLHHRLVILVCGHAAWRRTGHDWLLHRLAGHRHRRRCWGSVGVLVEHILTSVGCIFYRNFLPKIISTYKF